MIIGCDIDGVLSDFNTSFVDVVISVTGKDLFPPRPFEIPTWHYPEHYGYSNDELRTVWAQIEQDPLFWFNLSPYPDASRFLQAVHAMNADVYFITSRGGVAVKLQTEAWLTLYGYPAPTVLISGQKGTLCSALNVTHYIDDKTENCGDVRDYSPETQCYMLERSWNRPIHSVPRIPELQTFLEEVMRASR